MFQKSWNSTGFIRVFATRFWLLRNRVLHWFYKVSRRSENALRKPSLGNAFLIISSAIFEKGPPKSSFSTGVIRFWAWWIPHVRFIYKPNGFWWFWRQLFSSGRASNPPLIGLFYFSGRLRIFITKIKWLRFWPICFLYRYKKVFHIQSGASVK